MPHSVEMPAPVKGTIRLGRGDQLAQAVDGAVEIGGDHRYNVRRAVPALSQ